MEIRREAPHRRGGCVEVPVAGDVSPVRAESGTRGLIGVIDRPGRRRSGCPTRIQVPDLPIAVLRRGARFARQPHCGAPFQVGGQAVELPGVESARSALPASEPVAEGLGVFPAQLTTGQSSFGVTGTLLYWGLRQEVAPAADPPRSRAAGGVPSHVHVRARGFISGGIPLPPFPCPTFVPPSPLLQPGSFLDAWDGDTARGRTGCRTGKELTRRSGWTIRAKESDRPTPCLRPCRKVRCAPGPECCRGRSRSPFAARERKEHKDAKTPDGSDGCLQGLPTPP